MANATIPTDTAPISLGDRMKAYEKTTHIFLDRNLPFVVRLDGKNFSSLTRGLNKPFDVDFSNCMVATATDLLVEFDARTAYTQSDEISLLFYPSLNEGDNQITEGYQHIFNGRVDKIVSVMASFATARFNYYASRTEWVGRKPETIVKLTCHRACFDGRAFSLDPVEMANHIVWRCGFDCVRNSISLYAHTVFGPKKIHNKSGSEMKEMLAANQTPWDAMPDRFKYGIFVKKNKILQAAVSGEQQTRSHPISFSYYAKKGEDIISIMSDKYITQEQIDNLSNKSDSEAI